MVSKNKDAQPAYYAVIPADVRYDTKLSANAKLLYGEITALCNKRGFCWANNTYFSKLYSKTNRVVTNWVSELQKAGHIRIELDHEKGNRRCLYLWNKTSRAMEEKFHSPIEENFHRPIEEKFQHNNTESNTTRSNNTSKPSSTCSVEVPVLTVTVAGTAQRKKLAPKKESIHQGMIQTYHDWHLKEFQIKPQIDGSDTKVVKNIVYFLERNIAKEGVTVIQAFEMILKRHRKWDKFYQDKTRLRQIATNLHNIVINLKKQNDGSSYERIKSEVDEHLAIRKKQRDSAARA